MGLVLGACDGAGWTLRLVSAAPSWLLDIYFLPCVYWTPTMCSTLSCGFRKGKSWLSVAEPITFQIYCLSQPWLRSLQGKSHTHKRKVFQGKISSVEKRSGNEVVLLFCDVIAWGCVVGHHLATLRGKGRPLRMEGCRKAVSAADFIPLE